MQKSVPGARASKEKRGCQPASLRSFSPKVVSLPCRTVARGGGGKEMERGRMYMDTEGGRCGCRTRALSAPHWAWEGALTHDSIRAGMRMPKVRWPPCPNAQRHLGEEALLVQKGQHPHTRWWPCLQQVHAVLHVGGVGMEGTLVQQYMALSRREVVHAWTAWHTCPSPCGWVFAQDLGIRRASH